MPEHSMIINVCQFPPGNRSLNTVMGAVAVKVPPIYGKFFDITLKKNYCLIFFVLNR